MKVFIVTWVDIDDDCPKKSEVEIIGVYSTLEKAQEKIDSESSKTGYSDDSRCWYHFVSEVNIDEMIDEIKNTEVDDMKNKQRIECNDCMYSMNLFCEKHV